MPKFGNDHGNVSEMKDLLYLIMFNCVFPISKVKYLTLFQKGLAFCTRDVFIEIFFTSQVGISLVGLGLIVYRDKKSKKENKFAR